MLGLEVVLASGEVLRTGRRTVKGVAGYDLTRLFVGSEGTLGVITEATLALRPAAAKPRTAAALFADRPGRGGDGRRGRRRPGTVPEPARDHGPDVAAREQRLPAGPTCPQDAAPCSSGSRTPGRGRRPRRSPRSAAIAAACGATDVLEADDPAEAELLLAARRSVLTALEPLGTTLIDDVAVPRTRLADLIEARRGDRRRGTACVIGVVGHAGDGNMHPTVVFDAADPVRRPARAPGVRRDHGRRRSRSAARSPASTGSGVLKRDWLAREAGPVAMEVHRSVKAALDPLGILNPGKVFDLA